MLAVAISILVASDAKAQTLYGSAGSLQNRENAHNADWAYNWGVEPDNNPFSVDVANYEFVPMIWSPNIGGTNINGNIDKVLALESNFGVHVDYVLGFNEPELPTQSNVSVESALENWKIMTDRFSGTDIKLVSPAVSGGGAIRVNDPNRPDGWLTEFMDEVENRNADADPDNDLQVDVIAYHFYSVAFNGTSEANKLIAQIDDLWARYRRPIWITEFAGTSFSLDNPVHSVEERTAFNREFLDALIPQFDARDYVERVSWWQFGALGRPYSRLSTVSNGVYTPSPIGEAYMRTTLDAGQTYNFATRDLRPTYVHYLKGSNLSNSGVTLSGMPVFNEGAMVVEGGTLQLEGETELTGQGTLRVDLNGTLATSGSDVALNSQNISLNRGLLHVKDGLATVSEELLLSNSSEIRTDGNLVISGGTTGAGAILATGPGTLFLSGNGSNNMGAQVAEGSFIVANADTSATGPGSILIDGSGLFGGFGLVDGDVVSEGAMSPGIAEGVSGATPEIDAGVVVDALDFDFSGVQDDAPLTQTSNLNDALQIVSGLDFGPGLQPRNASNDGDEFNVSGFTTVNNWTSAAANQDYLTFTVAPVEGLAIKLENVSVELQRNGVNAARLYRMFTSIDGFNVWNAGLTPLTWILDEDDTSKNTVTRSYPGNEIVTEPIEVRIYGWFAGSSSGNTRFTNLSINASFFSDPDSIALDPTGILELGGNYTQLDFATLKIDLGGTQAGEFDQLQVDGNAALSGTLDVSMIDGFDGVAGQTFDIITANAVTGTFDNVIAPDGMEIRVNYSDSVVSLELADDFLLGDVNLDGAVNFLDIRPFISVLSSGGFQIEADIDESGTVDFLDITPFIAILSGS